VSLQARIGTADHEVMLIERAIADLMGMGKVFATKELGTVEIQEIGSRLSTFLVQRTNIGSHTIVRYLLGDKFAGHRTQTYHFEPAIEWARSVGDLAPRMQSVLLQGDPRNAQHAIEATLHLESQLTEICIRLSDVAKIDIASFTYGRSLREAAEVLEAASSDGDGLFAFATFASTHLWKLPRTASAARERETSREFVDWFWRAG
jgi:hypothetical protein